MQFKKYSAKIAPKLTFYETIFTTTINTQFSIKKSRNSWKNTILKNQGFAKWISLPKNVLEKPVDFTFQLIHSNHCLKVVGEGDEVGCDHHTECIKKKGKRFEIERASSLVRSGDTF